MNPLNLMLFSMRLYRPAKAAARWLSWRAAQAVGPTFSKRENGQGLVEYALILALVAIVVIVVLALLGPAIKNVFTGVICSLLEGPDFDPNQDYELHSDGTCTVVPEAP